MLCKLNGKQLVTHLKKMNVKIFERFRAACDEFFKRKAEFFKSIKESMAGNLEKKKALCEKAEALKESTDWKQLLIF